MRCVKAFGERIAAREPARETAGIEASPASFMNRFNVLDAAEIVRVA